MFFINDVIPGLKTLLHKSNALSSCKK